MATVGEAIAATLIAQWNVGTGGTRPDPIQYLVERPERDPNPTVADAIYVWLPLRRTFDPIDVAEVYRNVTYTLRIVCHTKTSSARQLEIENEVDRILSSGTVITGATRQRVKEINDISNRSYSNLPKYISEVIMEVFTAMEVSATAYGTATATTLTTDELIVNTSITGDPTAALGETIISDDLDVESGNGPISNRLLAALSVKEDNAILIEETGTTQAVGIGIGDGDMKFYVNAFGDLAMTVSDTAPFPVSLVGDLITGETIKSQADNKGLYTGAGDDLRIYHTGAFTLIINATGALVIRNSANSDNNWDIRAGWSIRDFDDGFVELINLESNARTLAIGLAADPIDVTIAGHLKTAADKSKDIGATGVAWDNVYADDFVNESPFMEIDRPLDAIKSIKAKEGRLDYGSLPDWVRTFNRDHSQDKTHTETVMGEDADGLPVERVITVMDEVGPKSIIAERGYSMNRMIVLLYQALQEATARIEALEAA